MIACDVLPVAMFLFNEKAARFIHRLIWNMSSSVFARKVFSSSEMHLLRIEFSKVWFCLNIFLWQNPKLCIFNLEADGSGGGAQLSEIFFHLLAIAAAAFLEGKEEFKTKELNTAWLWNPLLPIVYNPKTCYQFFFESLFDFCFSLKWKQKIKYHCQKSMVCRITIAIDGMVPAQPLVPMVFQWFFRQSTIGNDGFRWLPTIGPTMR